MLRSWVLEFMVSEIRCDKESNSDIRCDEGFFDDAFFFVDIIIILFTGFLAFLSDHSRPSIVVRSVTIVDLIGQ